VVAELGEGEVGGVDGDAEFLAGFAGFSGGEGLAFVQGAAGSCPSPSSFCCGR
jgi:hypothetical protein